MQVWSLDFRRIVRAPREQVFADWMSPESLMRRWGAAAATCSEVHVDLRAGGCYRIALEMPDGSTVRVIGNFETVRAPETLAYSWMLSSAPDEATRVTVAFLPHPDGTEVLLHQEGAIDRDKFTHPLHTFGA